jgi:hypothetical protein
MKTTQRTLAALVALGFAFLLVPISTASGDPSCQGKCKDAQQACDQNCDVTKVTCIARCGGPAPVGNQACNDKCAQARTDCGNTCQANELICEGKCLIPLPIK